MTIRRNWAIA